jgi:hypothetical protein
LERNTSREILASYEQKSSLAVEVGEPWSANAVCVELARSAWGKDDRDVRVRQWGSTDASLATNDVLSEVFGARRDEKVEDTRSIGHWKGCSPAFRCGS